jgi:8-oxo-dGTP pyrophosphatase MutT (NUDIX family)
MPDQTTYGGPPNQMRPGASAAIFDAAGRLLLQRRSDNGYWGLPGGGMDLGESVAQTVVREVREETGYEVEVVRLIGVYSDPAHSVINYPDGNRVQSIVCLFECRVVGGAPALSDETTALEWFSLDALPRPFVPNHVIRIRDIRARQTAAFFR